MSGAEDSREMARDDICALATEVNRAYAGDSIDSRLRHAMRLGRGTVHPGAMRAALESAPHAPTIRNEDVIREIMSTMGVGYQEAKVVYRHSFMPPGTVKRVRDHGGGFAAKKRDMLSQEAKRIVADARARILAVDEGG
jgi:hypothetical protein